MSTPRASDAGDTSRNVTPSATSAAASGPKEFPTIPLTAEFLKMLGTTDEKAIYALKPVFATRCERLSSTNKLLERAVMISQIGTLRIIDTSSGRITHTVEFGEQRNLDWNIEVEADEAADPSTHVQGVRIVIDKCATADAFANVDDEPQDKPEELCLFFHCKRSPVAVSFVAMLKHFAALRGSRTNFHISLARESLLEACRKDRGGLGNTLSSMRKSSIFASPERTTSVVEVAKKKKKESEKKGEVIVVPPPAVVPSVREQKRREKEEKERQQREAEEQQRREEEAAAAKEREEAEQRRREDEQREAEARNAAEQLKRQAEATTHGYDSDDDVDKQKPSVASNPLIDVKAASVAQQDLDDVEVVDEPYAAVAVRSAPQPAPTESTRAGAAIAAGPAVAALGERKSPEADDAKEDKSVVGIAPRGDSGGENGSPPESKGALGELLRLMKAQTAVAKSGISDTTSTDMTVDDYGGGTEPARDKHGRHRRGRPHDGSGQGAVAGTLDGQVDNPEDDEDGGYIDPHRYFGERDPSADRHGDPTSDPCGDAQDVIEDRFIDSLSAREAQQIVSGLIRSIEDLKGEQIRLMDERAAAMEDWRELTSVSLSSEHAIQLAQLIWDVCEMTLLQHFDR